MRPVSVACRVVCLAVGLLCAPAGQAVSPVPAVDLGDIPRRADPPEFAFERFARTRELHALHFAADGRSVYFLDNDGRVDNVFALALESGAIRQVTFQQEPVADFAVDHRGRFLVLVQDVRGNENNDLYRYDLQTRERTRLTDAGRGDTSMLCGLSPDDRTVYYAQTRDNRREAGLWQVGNDGHGARQLLAPGGRTLECDAVSPDGRYLLYGELIGFDTRHLGLLNLRSGKARVIAAVDGVNNLDAGFAGDSVYYRSALGADGFRLWRYLIGEDASRPLDLPGMQDIEALSLYTGGRVAVVTYRDRLGGKTAVFIDGFDVPDRFGLPPDSIVDAVFSRDDPSTGIIATETATSPRRYYRVGRGAPVLLYDANRSGIDERQFAEVRSVLIPAFDGLGIPTHLFIPNGTSGQRPRPVIVFIHGGPDEHIDPRYQSSIQFLANRGFIVVTPNVRGSTGFGKRYASLDDGDWGGAPVRDILAVVAALRGLDFVDADHLFVAGASFGGFMVMTLITRYPDTFDAAVDLFGFTELATFVASWPRYLQRHLQTTLGFDPRRDPRRNRQLSPIYHLERVRVPLQIHQGANDSRVPREQSDWLVQRLRRLGRTVEYFVYPDEGHGFTRLHNEADAYQRMVGFLRRYTK